MRMYVFFLLLYLSYFVTSQVMRFGHLSKAETLLDTILRFFATVEKEVVLPENFLYLYADTRG